jgi:hypothetical protein
MAMSSISVVGSSMMLKLYKKPKILTTLEREKEVGLVSENHLPKGALFHNTIRRVDMVKSSVFRGFGLFEDVFSGFRTWGRKSDRGYSAVATDEGNREGAGLRGIEEV